MDSNVYIWGCRCKWKYNLPPLKKSREKEINVLLTKIGWRSRNEPTWGSASSIEAISTKLMICPNLILTSLPLYKRDIIAFQLVRNTYMHQTPENFRNLLDCLRPDFIDVNSRNLSDILDVKSMYTQKSLFESALDSMYALITGIP